MVVLAQLLKNLEFKGNAGFDKVVEVAKSTIGSDRDGYRSEFIRLAETIKNLN